MDKKEKIVVREDLYEEVWSTPLSTLAKQYGISDVGLAKVCKKLEVPRPPVGYWQKVKAGKKVKKEPLPPLSKNGKSKAYIDPEAFSLSMQRPSKGEKTVTMPEDLSRAHPLVSKTENALEKAKPNEKGLIQPKKEKHFLDVRVSQSTCHRALLVMEAFLRALQQRGMEFGTQGKQGEFPTTWVLVDGETLNFGLEERLTATRHEASWEELRKPGVIPRYDYHPTGKLVLTIRNAPYGVQANWADGKKQRVEDSINAFVDGMFVAANQLRTQREGRERRRKEWEEELERRREKERLERLEAQKAEKLEADALAWEKAVRLRNYIEEMKKIPNPSKELIDWIQWAENYTHKIDPFSRGRVQFKDLY